jgi:oxygen-dependent protoporphyrinogen oxidase
VVIVGGGITGLSAAYYLEQSSDCEITLLEPGQLGGKVGTLHENGFLMELGPDCFFARKPEAMELIRSLGIENEVIEPKASGFSILVDDELHEVPHSLINFTDLDWAALDAATFLSPNGKERAKAEPLRPKGRAEDESIARFFRRRFGEEFSRKVVEPLMAGTHGGRADALSVKALYPTYVELERNQGSLAVERKEERGKRKDGAV